MKASTEQLVSALRVLSVEIHSEDGVANAVIAEAADRMTLLANLVAKHLEETREDTKQMQTACETMVEATATIQNLRARIKRLEEVATNQRNRAEKWYIEEREDGDSVSIATTRAYFLAYTEIVREIRKAKELTP